MGGSRAAAARWEDPFTSCYDSGVEIVGFVKDGKVVVPQSVTLPEGARVRVVLEAGAASPDEPRPPLERRPLTDAAVDADIAWANGKRFAR